MRRWWQAYVDDGRCALVGTRRVVRLPRGERRWSSRDNVGTSTHDPGCCPIGQNNLDGRAVTTNATDRFADNDTVVDARVVPITGCLVRNNGLCIRERQVQLNSELGGGLGCAALAVGQGSHFDVLMEERTDEGFQDGGVLSDSL